jgi:uncharacterized membrane protein
MNEITPRRRFPWLKAALTLSLVLNLALLGVLGGLINRVGQSGSDLRSAVSALPAEDRRALRRETGRIWREARTQRGAEGSRAQMIAALRAEEFDIAAFERALQDAQERLVRMSDEMHGRLVTRVAQMSVEERVAYADALEAQARRWGGPRAHPAR